MEAYFNQWSDQPVEYIQLRSNLFATYEDGKKKLELMISPSTGHQRMYEIVLYLN
ncbi:MAG: hypothetical protein R8G66_25900 [Cytophagales bacterium]|nr:hypothetical protein [Cytophagales bacterium]